MATLEVHKPSAGKVRLVIGGWQQVRAGTAGTAVAGNGSTQLHRRPTAHHVADSGCVQKPDDEQAALHGGVQLACCFLFDHHLLHLAVDIGEQRSEGSEQVSDS